MRIDGDESGFFDFHSGVRQGCTAAPDLFNTLIDYVMRRVCERIQGISLGEQTLKDLEFADDTILLAPNLNELVSALTIYKEEAAKVGLEVNFTKTKIMVVSEFPPPSSVMVEDQVVEIVKDFIYLGSKINYKGDISTEISRRKGLASSTLRKLWQPLWRHRNISTRTKMRIYNACVLSILLYGSETWPLSATLAKRLAGFDHRAQRRVLNIHWREHITNVEVRHRSNQPPIQRVLAQRRLRWLGHVLRMTDDLPAKLALNYEPSAAGRRRPRGRPRTRWMEVVKEDLQKFDISIQQARELAQDRASWRRLVLSAVSTPHRHED